MTDGTKKAGTAFDSIDTINGILQLILQVGNLALPLFNGLLKDLKSRVQADGTIEYTLVLETGAEHLTQAEGNFRSSLDAINSELVRMGKAPLAVPPTSTP